MSSVLIKGMEMPKTCNICPCFERDWQDDDIVGYCKAKKTKLQKYKIPFDCPLVEVSPHGRLIDADALFEKLDISDKDFYVQMIRKLSTPTIIEAERNEE